MTARINIFVSAALLVVSCGGAAVCLAESPVDFLRDVRPILAANCYTCHGPDAQESGLRLDRRDAALAEADSGHPAIVPGNPNKSRLLKLVQESDPDLRMPQDADPLRPEQVAVLRRWIEAGAPYPKHWSNVNPAWPSLPPVSDMDWPRSSLDYFVLARMRGAGLSPNEPADRYALCRRVYLDLIGLPPTVEDADEFVADLRPDAYERLVDRLLASPRYGERWARWWLDLARYADTNGYESDEPRIMWPYRDWVVRALNANQPFDEFTIDQIAGDLRPGATLDQQVATGFHRNTLINTEAGSRDDEFKDAAIKDRVDTTATVWLGATMGCAQCHNHKYDPFTQREYYQLYAFFNNTTDKAVDGENDTLDVFFGDPAEVQRLQAEVARVESQLAADAAAYQEQQARWEKDLKAKLADNDRRWIPLLPESSISKAGAAFARQPDKSLLVTGPNADHDTYVVTLRTTARRVSALRLEALTDPSHTNQSLARSSNGNFVLTDFRVETKESADSEYRTVELRDAEADFSQKGYPVIDAINGEPENGWAVAGHELRENREALFIFDQPLTFDRETLLRVSLHHESEFVKHNIGRFRLSIATHEDPRLDDAFTVPDDIRLILDVAPDERHADQAKRLHEHYREFSPDFIELRSQLDRAKQQLATYEQTMTTTVMIMKEGPPRETHVQKRGNFLSLAAQVQADVPNSFELPLADAEPNRLTFARWVVHPDNPRTARVTVNRIWDTIFGQGLVGTSEDFGAQGDLPTHPELLDCLAVEFVESGWDIKRLLRTIVTSATYRQSSRTTREKLAADRYNRWLSRGPRFRLEAEAVRDTLLSAGGLLSSKMGGTAVFPPQPEVVWEGLFIEGGYKRWPTSRGEDRFRRALYTFVKRTALHPMLRNFDASNRTVCTVDRKRSNTPLGALNTLNDPAFVEAAGGLARRMAGHEGAAETKADYGFRACATRPPKARELSAVLRLYETTLAHYTNHPHEAREAVNSAFGQAPPDADIAELAAWIVVANTLLNMDATLTKG